MALGLYVWSLATLVGAWIFDIAQFAPDNPSRDARDVIIGGGFTAAASVTGAAALTLKRSPRPTALNFAGALAGIVIGGALVVYIWASGATTPTLTLLFLAPVIAGFVGGRGRWSSTACQIATAGTALLVVVLLTHLAINELPDISHSP